MYTQTNLSLRLLSIVDPTRESIYLNTALTSGHVQQHQHVIEVQLVQLNGCDQQIGTNGLHALNVVLKGLLVLNPSNQSFKVKCLPCSWGVCLALQETYEETFLETN